MSAGFIPTPVSNCLISTEKITSNFLDGSPLNTSEVAVPLIALILPAKRLSGIASSCSVASWPSFRLARSSSPTFAHTSTSERSRISATGMPGCKVSPSRMSGICCPKLKLPARFCLVATRPVIGASVLHSAMRCNSRCTSIRLRLRCSCSTASCESACSWRAAMSVSNCCSARFCCSSVSTFFLPSISAMIGLRCTSSSARRTL